MVGLGRAEDNSAASSRSRINQNKYDKYQDKFTLYEIIDVNRVGRGTNKQRVMGSVNSNYELSL